MNQAPFVLPAVPSVPGVAIIGGGPGGSAAAYYLSRLSPNTSITLYEKSNYIGGRSTTIDVLGQTIELGASIFVDVNINLKTVKDLFGLELAENSLTSKEGSLGIWNGKEFVFHESGGSGLWDLAKMFWKYGLSPYRAKKHVTSIIDKFVKMYDMMPFASLQTAAAELGLLEYVNVTAWESYDRAGVSEKFRRDVINAATRVNYAQEITGLNGLLGAVSFVTDDAMAIKGGNWQIFAMMIEESRATVQLNHAVKSITKHKSGLGWQVCGSEACESFGQVVIAHPLSLSEMTIDPPILIRPVEYVPLHVTILATRFKLSPGYFGTDQIPGLILTTQTEAGESPDFQSLSIVGKVGASDDLLIYKIFSKKEITDAWLHEVFEIPKEAKHEMEYIYRHLWQAYPVYDTDLKFDAFEQGDGLWYLNGMERFISTMETATMAGKNVAGLVYEHLRGASVKEML